ncbi:MULTISPECIES: ATP-binding cassette domain-containing protein [unclassified Marinitoga]|uniref:ATP-binding cassette domain-containing protein n=1 Tax=unclassified Marinitoga TaxID=2640159 RepID=UPI0006417EEA|nr:MULTISPECIES: ATP-binding cassette domain-containing protein [unclassified Marinitoga]KLO23014.1 xylose ABC transporter ATP-binding protein [Marinitoga sp. 1155]NUV00037.1 ABC transporter ATP-binding protein [Marinitoga sp. 1154]
MNDYILEMNNITKEFPGVKALDNVNFKVKKGEIHCLVGENGSGKSTLMKILSGFHTHGSYTGQIIFEGKEMKFKNIYDSEKVGIVTIYQELALIPELTIYENIFLGHEIKNNGVIDWNKTISESKKVLKKLGYNMDTSKKVKELGVGLQQIVEIGKALSKNVKLLILDEPTSSLNETDSENLLRIVKELKNHGITSILISHKLKEVLEVADTITVLRDGLTITTIENKNITENDIVKYMVGREIEDIYPKRNHIIGEKLFEIKNWKAYDKKDGKYVVKSANFYVKKGEIVGIAGLIGAGRTELAHSIFGNPDNYIIDGELYFEGKKQKFRSTSDAIKAGIAYVSEDRKGNGLILDFDIKTNITIANLKNILKNIYVDENEEIIISEKYRKSLKIKSHSIEQKVLNLSGGNQQKVQLAKWLFVSPKLLILDEPTRGIDVGAKHEIYTIMNKLVEEGMSIIMISSELPEVLGMSDRIYVMAGGKIVGELNSQEATQEKIMTMAVEY